MSCNCKKRNRGSVVSRKVKAQSVNGSSIKNTNRNLPTHNNNRVQVHKRLRPKNTGVKK